MDLSAGLMVTLMLEDVAQPPSAEISVTLDSADLAFPSTCQRIEEAGFELEVMQSKFRVWPTFAVSGPLISTRSGATKS